RTIAVAVLILAVFGVACGGGETAGRTPAPTAEATTRPIIILPLGRTGSRDGAEITLHSVRRSTQQDTMTAPEGREWLLVDLTVRNSSEGAFSLQIEFRDRDEVPLERAHPPGVEPALESPISPGQEVRGEVAFLAPARMLGGTIIYGPGEYRWALEMGMFSIEESARTVRRAGLTGRGEI